MLYFFFVLSLERRRVSHVNVNAHPCAAWAPRAPWQNGFAEMFVGTIRRELLDHVIVLGERHLLKLLRDYDAYCNADRPHSALDGDSPAGARGRGA